MSCQFRTNCFFALFYKYKPNTFVSVLRCRQFLIRPNNYLLCPLRNYAIYSFTHLTLTVAVTFILRDNTVMSHFYRFGQLSRIPRYESNRFSAKNRYKTTLFGNLRIIVKKIVKFLPLILPIVLKSRLERITVFQKICKRTASKICYFFEFNIHCTPLNYCLSYNHYSTKNERTQTILREI